MTLSLLVAFAAWLLAGFVMVVTGFGGPLLALPIMLFFVDLQSIIQVNIVLGLLGCLPVLRVFWRSIEWRRAWLLTAASVPGVAAGVLTLRHAPMFWLQLALGVTLIAVFAWQLAAERSSAPARPHTIPAMVAAGAGAGFFSGCVGLGGPPLAVYVHQRRWEKNAARGTLAVYYAASLALAVAFGLQQGLVTDDAWRHIAAAVPGMIIGTLIGLPAAKRLPQRLFEQITLLVILAGGISLLWKAFFMQPAP